MQNTMLPPRNNPRPPRHTSIFAPDSPWLTTCLVICGVLVAVGPLTSNETRLLMMLLRQELARSGLLARVVVQIEPWHYLTERVGGKVELSATGRSMYFRQTNQSSLLIHQTLTRWRTHHAKNA